MAAVTDRHDGTWAVAHDVPALRPRWGVDVLLEDPELLTGLPGELRATARRHLRARALHLDRGPWDGRTGRMPERFDGWLGMLVLDGLLIRTVSVGGLECCELLGAGDLLRPWAEDSELGTVEARTSWRVIDDARIALLDDSFALRAARWPALTGELLDRTMRRSRALTVYLAIAQARRADARLRALFWHLADRWGRVTPDGVVLRLRLTHSVLSHLACLRRPSVSMALRDLERSGEIVRLSRDAWLIANRDPAAAAAA